MFTSRICLKLVMLTILTFYISSCKKPEGPGGRATVKGKVYANDWENTQRVVISRGYASGERVYIMYGKETTVGNDVRTGPDGTFEFKYLNKGKYRVFVNSLDTTIIGYKGNDTEKPVIMEFEIKETKEAITLKDIVINK